MFKSKNSNSLNNTPQYTYATPNTNQNPSTYERRSKLSSKFKSTINSRLSDSRYGNIKPLTKNKMRRMLRKALFVVAFPILLKS